MSLFLTTQRTVLNGVYGSGGRAELPADESEKALARLCAEAFWLLVYESSVQAIGRVDSLVSFIVGSPSRSSREEAMPFTLSRSGRGNVPAEVQRWQYFLRRQNVPQTGNVDGQFGLKTEAGTKIFQLGAGLPANGKVDARTLEKASGHGYTIVPDDYYELRAGTDFPRPPSAFSTPSNSTRNRDFTCFQFLQRPLNQRPDAEAIVIKGSCDGQHQDWENDHIIEFDMPQLRFARGYNGIFRCHVKAAPVFKALFEQWERDDMLHLIVSFEGCFVPRYKRNQAPAGRSGHAEKKSSDVDALSNHSFGSAFDINFVDNMLGTVPAVSGQRGSVRELVSAANSLGIFWGGHFNNPKDGMHFEISKLPARR